MKEQREKRVVTLLCAEFEKVDRMDNHDESVASANTIAVCLGFGDLRWNNLQ